MVWIKYSPRMLLYRLIMASFAHLEVLCVTFCSFVWWVDRDLLWFPYFDSVDWSLALRTYKSNHFCQSVASIWKWKPPWPGHCQMASQPGRGTSVEGKDLVIGRHSGVFLDWVRVGSTCSLSPAPAGIASGMLVCICCLLPVFLLPISSTLSFSQLNSAGSFSSSSASFASSLFQGWSDKA